MTNWLYRKTGEFLKDAVYAANDGIITTFAVVAGVVGASAIFAASLSPLIILILGFANLFADGLSMASGNYLGTKSEKDLYNKERNRHKIALSKDREAYKKHIEKFLQDRGYSDKKSDLADLMISNQSFALDFVMHEELGLVEQEEARPLKGAFVTLAAFMLAGLVPLLPYVFFTNSPNAFLLASIFTGLALFTVGAARSVYMERSWISAGLEMFFIGGIAAAVAYGIGFAVSQIVG